MTNLPGTPTVQQLRRFAADNPFPPEWLDGDEEDLFYEDSVMICFCQCARDHTWEDPTAIVQCRCGRILESMSVAEHAEAVAQHEASGRRMLEANNMEPFIQLFQD
jgi:hypothetical protein